ncbi:MAG TPA: hypothetical protein DCZ95_05740 [Verrucomicrobia bacterium]|nr:MAG: hypothetical protein A2X46_09980 [Lentisphaerae bacterium GWF2_57_35]HBA83579.1 hypothetical protein [Verrucomicrobiota bacterium]
MINKTGVCLGGTLFHQTLKHVCAKIPRFGKSVIGFSNAWKKIAGLAGAFTVAMGISAQAEPTWSGNGADGNWDTAANWIDNVAPGPESNLVFYSGIGSGTNINLNGNREVYGLRFENNADTSLNFYNNTLTINNGGLGMNVDCRGNHVIASDVVLGADQIWSNAVANSPSATLTVSGNISGSGSLTLQGCGYKYWGFDFSGNNTFTNAVTLERGTILTLKHPNALGSTSAGIRINDISSLRFQGTNTFQPETIRLNGTGSWYEGALLSLSGSNTLTGPIVLERSSIINLANNATLVLDSSTPITGTDLNLTVAGWGSGGNLIVNSVIDTGSGYVRLGENAPDVALLAVNTYSGGTIVYDGILRINSDRSLGAIPSAFSANNISMTYGTLIHGDVPNIALHTNRGITLNDGCQSKIEVYSNRTLTCNSCISGSGHLRKQGLGTLLLATNNTYSGNTEILGGTMIMNGSNATASITMTWNTGGRLCGIGSIGPLNLYYQNEVDPGADPNSVGNLKVSSLTVHDGTTQHVHIANATAGTGTGWDVITVGGGSGTTTYQQFLGYRIIVKLDSMGVTPTGWNPTNSYNWVIVDAGVLNGFNTNLFVLDTSAWTGDLKKGAFSLCENGGNLVIKFSPYVSSIIFDNFTSSSGSLNGGSEGRGWADNWSLGGDPFADYVSSSFNAGYSSYIDPTANKVVLYGDVNGRWVSATRTFDRTFTTGRVYFSYMMNYAYNGNNKYAGIKLLADNTEVAFIGKCSGADKALGISDTSDDRISSYALQNGSGNDYIVAGVYDFSTRQLNATAYKISSDSACEMIAEEPQGYWQVTTTQTVGQITKLTGIRLIAGSLSGSEQVGYVYYDEVRVGTNWYEVTRKDGEFYYDEEAVGPIPELIYIGTDYSAGLYGTSLTEAEALNSSDKLDIAVRWSSPFGVFLTNNPNTFNIGSRAGRVCPNWDPLRIQGSVTNSLGMDTNFASFYGYNGALVVTTYYKNAFSITNSKGGETYCLSVSAENNNDAGGLITAPNGFSAAPVRRGITINSNLLFSVTDDDSEYPTLISSNRLRCPSFEEGNSLSTWHAPGYTNWGKDTIAGLGSGTPSHARTGSQWVQMNAADSTYETVWQPVPAVETNWYTFSIWAKIDDIAKLDMTNLRGYFLYLKMECWSLDTNNLYAGSGLLLTNQIDFTAGISTNYRQFTHSMKSCAGTKSIRVCFGFAGNTSAQRVDTVIYWDDASIAQAVHPLEISLGGVNISPDQSGTINGNVGGHADWTNAQFSLSDAQLATVSPATPLRMIFSMMDNDGDGDSGLMRGTTDPSTQMNVTVENLTTQNVANFTLSESSPQVETKAFFGTNVWTFTSISESLLDALIDQGTNKITATVWDADTDRENDQLCVSNQQFGLLHAYDDDSVVPTVKASQSSHLLIDGDFEAGPSLTPWVLQWNMHSAWCTIAAGSAETGARGLTLFTGLGNISSASQYVDVMPNKNYDFVSSGKIGGNWGWPPSSVGMRCRFFDAANSQVGESFLNLPSMLTGSWQVFTNPCTAPATAVKAQVAFDCSGWPGNAYVYFDNASFTCTNAGYWPPKVLIGSTEYYGPTNGPDESIEIYDGDLAGVSAGNPLKVLVYAYDNYSGLQRSTTGNASTQLNLSVGTLTTNNIANYNAAQSSSVTTSSTAQSIWSWNSISSNQLSALFEAGSNRIAVSVWDCDSDRSDDQAGLTNVAYAWLKVIDDDTNPPSIALIDSAMTYVTNAQFAHVTLNNTNKYASGNSTNRVFLLTDNELSTLSAANVLRLSVGAFDANGLSRTNLAGASTNQYMSISIGGALTNNTVNYSAQESSEFTSTISGAQGSTNVWSFGAPFTAIQLDAWMTEGTNAIVATIPDADADRANDAAVLYSQQVGYLVVNDNDSEAPTVSNLVVLVGDSVAPLIAGANTTNVIYRLTDGDLASAGSLPVKISFNVYDHASGIPRNNIGPESNMNVTVEALTTNNVANYVPTMSALNAKTSGATSLWAWTESLWQESVSNLYGPDWIVSGETKANATGSWRKVYANVPDADNDRLGDRQWRSNQQFGILWIADDDTDGPVFGAGSTENLLRNGDFERASFKDLHGAYGWEYDDPDVHGGRWGTATRQNNYSGGGYPNSSDTNIATIGGAWAGGTGGGWWQDAPAMAGQRYEGGAWFWSDTTPAFTARYCEVKVEFYSTNTLLVSATNRFNAPGEVWTWHSATGLAPAGSARVRLVLAAEDVSAGGSMRLDDAKLWAAELTNLVMDVTIGQKSDVIDARNSCYGWDSGTNAVFYLTDGDLAEVSATRPLQFMFRVYDPSSGVMRSVSDENLNYDLGTVDTLEDCHANYVESRSSSDTKNALSTSVFANVQNYTVGGEHNGSVFVETGEVWQLMAAGINTVTVSGPNDDVDRGSVDREWTINRQAGLLMVADDDDEWPSCILLYAGDAYTPGIAMPVTITDGQMTNGFDFAYRLYDRSGLWMTNRNGVANLNGNFGNVSPNWDLKNPWGIYLKENVVHAPTNLLAPTGNGSLTVTASEYNVSISYANNATGTWVLQASAQDNDQDRGFVALANGTTVSLDRAVASDMAMNFTVIDDDLSAPAAHSLNVKNGRTMLDSDIRFGQWNLSVVLEDNSEVALATNGGYSLPHYSLLNAHGTVQTNVGWLSATKQLNTNAWTMARAARGISYSNVTTGVHAFVWSAMDKDADRSNDWMQAIDSPTIFNGTNVFTVIDDDTNYPTAPSAVHLQPSAWTNRNLFTLAFVASEDDSGIYQYRLSTNAAAPTSITNGQKLSAIYVTNILSVSISNGSFEIGSDELTIPAMPQSTNNWMSGSTGGAGLHFADEAGGQAGSLAVRHEILDGVLMDTSDRYTLCSQEVYLNNTNRLSPTVNYIGYFHGDLSRVGFGGNQAAAFLKAEGFNIGSNRCWIAGGEYNVEALVGVNPSSWTQALLAVSNAPADTEFIRFSCGISGHGSRLAATGYWDSLSISVSVQQIGSVLFTNAPLGITTNWFFAVDDDNDRPEDRLKSPNTNFVIMYDNIAPTQIMNLIATPGSIDDASEMDLTWSKPRDGGGNGSDPLSPWRTYKIYYTEDGSEPSTTNGSAVTLDSVPALSDRLTESITLSNFTFGVEYNVAIAGVDSAGNEGPLSEPKSVLLSGFFITQGVVNAETDLGKADIAWTAAEGREYDLIYVDALDFTSALSNRWKLVERGAASMLSDTGNVAMGRVAPKNLGSNMRFYRAAQKDRWTTNWQRRVASEEVYVLKSIRLHPGKNWVAFPGIPDTCTAARVFGHSLPSGGSDVLSTRVSWFSRGTTAIATQCIWLSSAPLQWRMDNQNADDISVPIHQGVLIEIPDNETARTTLFIGRVPTNSQTQLIKGGTMANPAYNLASFAMPRNVRPSQMNLIESGFQGGDRPSKSDKLLKYDRVHQQISGAGVWYKTNDATWREATSANGAIIGNSCLTPDDGFVILTVHPDDWVWTNKVLYTLPTRYMNP